MRHVRIYVLFHLGVFRDVYASYSAAVRDKHLGGCCEIRSFDREEY